MTGKVYLIPTVLYEDEKAFETIASYVLIAVKDCSVFFVENEKTSRRYLKKLWKEMVINDYEWHNIHKVEEQAKGVFIQRLQNGKNIGIICEAGCAGIADPGQILIAAAQEINATIKPLVGPNSILLALMASGMNGQCFQFVGYLPIESSLRKNKLKELETDSLKRNCTQIFIETPYRNNQLLKDILQTCINQTRLCIGINITSATESIQTKKIIDWQKQLPELHKQPVIFLLHAN